MVVVDAVAATTRCRVVGGMQGGGGTCGDSGGGAGWCWCLWWPWGLYFLLFSKMFAMRQQWCTTVFNSFHG
jgi:hypothetical protein